MKENLIGQQHIDLTNWLSDQWWSESESPVTIIQGFPGAGKTHIADVVCSRMVTGRRAKFIRCQCPPVHVGILDDLLLSLASAFANANDDRLASTLDLDTLWLILREPVLIVIDEFQDSFDASMSKPDEPLARFVEEVSISRNLRGRILLLSSREIDDGRWSERCNKRLLAGLSPIDGMEFLEAQLRASGLSDSELPRPRRRDIVNWLGGYPRALRLFVNSLRHNSIDELIGMVPEAWEARNQRVSEPLLRKVEELMVSRARQKLPQDADRFLQRIAVYRQPLDTHAMIAVGEGYRPADIGAWKDELHRRFLLERRSNYHTLHPVLRETLLLTMDGNARQRAHTLAGKFFGRHFLAKEMVGMPGKLGAAFLEARYHFTQANDSAQLKAIAAPFEDYVRKRMGWTTPLPMDTEELDERIALLLALLDGEGAKSLHFYLAKLLQRRSKPGDLERALEHAKKATGPDSPSEAWLLRLRLIERCEGAAAAVCDIREFGLVEVPQHKNLAHLYQGVSEILAAMGERAEAIRILEQGIAQISPAYDLSALYVYAAELIAKESRDDRMRAIELLKAGIDRVPPKFNLHALYLRAAELLTGLGYIDDALNLLDGSLKRVPAQYGLSHLYLHAAQLLERTGDVQQALSLLRRGVSLIEPNYDLTPLYLRGALLLLKVGEFDEGMRWTEEGMERTDPRYTGFPLANLRLALTWARAPSRLDELTKSYSKQESLKHLAASAAMLGHIMRDPVLAVIRMSWPLLTPSTTTKLALAQAAFCHLCAGQAGNAKKLMDAQVGTKFTDELSPYGTSMAWLNCFIAIELGEQERADELLDTLLGRPHSAAEHADRPTLVSLWQRAVATSDTRAIQEVFPVLTPRLIGQPAVMTSNHSAPPASSAHMPGHARRGADTGDERATLNAKSMIVSCCPRGWAGLYVLGCFDRRITFYTQQVRALALIRSLFDCNDLQAGQSVAVIGAGAAGITAAVAAAKLGCLVTLFDDHDEVLTLQAAAHHRYLHPHIYDWPAVGATVADAGLPFLDWTADNSDRVVEKLRAEFADHVATFGGRLQFRGCVSINHIRQVRREPGERRVELFGNEARVNDQFHVVLVAAGFGVEASRFPGVDTPSYWSGDTLDMSSATTTSILVSGTGDGGMVDVARAAIRSRPGQSHFRHDEAVVELTGNPHFQQLARQMLEIDEVARDEVMRGHSDVRLYSRYKKLVIPPELLEQIKGLKRRDTKVTFNFRDPGIFALDAALLNRLLVFLMLEAEMVELKWGQIKQVAASPANPSRKSVTFEVEGASDTVQEYDLVVLRHGPSEQTPLQRFPLLEAAHRELGGKVADLAFLRLLELDEMARWFA